MHCSKSNKLSEKKYALNSLIGVAFIQDLANFENALNDVIVEVYCTIKEIHICNTGKN